MQMKDIRQLVKFVEINAVVFERKDLGGYVVEFFRFNGPPEWQLTGQKGNLRVFKKLDSVASTLSEIGIRSFRVNLSGDDLV
jgi:hypothetical protein